MTKTDIKPTAAVRRVTSLTGRLRAAETKVDEIRRQRDEAVRDAVSEGRTLRAVAAIAGITHNAVAKIVNAGPRHIHDGQDGG